MVALQAQVLDLVADMTADSGHRGRAAWAHGAVLMRPSALAEASRSVMSSIGSSSSRARSVASEAVEGRQIRRVRRFDQVVEPSRRGGGGYFRAVVGQRNA